MQGAKPLFFLDYIATGKVEPGLIESVIAGVARACRENGTALLGGETAEMPGFYAAGDYDVAGTIVGVVDRAKIVDGTRIAAGDVALGLPSIGLQTNGYTLARRVFFETMGKRPEDTLDELDGRAIGDVLLDAHLSYGKAMAPLLEADLVHGMAHLTGGGFYDNIPRVLPENLDVDRQVGRVAGAAGLRSDRARGRGLLRRDAPRVQHGHRHGRLRGRRRRGPRRPDLERRGAALVRDRERPRRRLPPGRRRARAALRMQADRKARPAGRIVAAVAAAALAGLVPFLFRIRAWPEIAAPAYFLSRGGRLYDEIFFPHTPLLISALGGLGAAFGFSAFLFRAVVAAGMAATSALVVAGLERERGFVLAAAVGMATSVLWLAYLGGLAVWPDVLIAPIVLAAALRLERSDPAGSSAPLRGAGLLLGAAILVKQTSAWVALAAIVWAVARRYRLARIGELAAMIALPYVVFALLWGIVFRTTAHVYWTVVWPLVSSAGIRSNAGWGGLHEALAAFLVVPAAWLLETAARDRRPSPMPLMVLATAGMAWPRGDLLHLTAAVGMIALLTARCVLCAMRVFERWRRGALARWRLAAGTVAFAMLVTALAVAALSGGDVLANDWRGEVFYWDDPLTNRLSAEIAERVPRGGKIFLYDTHRDNLYARSGTTTPDGLYVNTSFWYCYRGTEVDRRMTADLRRFPGWILYREPGPDDTELRDTSLYGLLSGKASTAEEAPDSLTWKRLAR